MARIFLSPLIVDIRASQSDTVFSKWRGINYIRSRVIPANPKTVAQVAIREALARLVTLWQGIITTSKTNQNFWAKGKDLSGFNRFIQKNTVDERDGNEIDVCEDNGYPTLTAFSCATGPTSGDIIVTFAPTPVPTGKKLIIIARETGAGSWAATWEIAAAQTSPQTIDGIPGGTEFDLNAWLQDDDATPTGDLIGDDMSDRCTSGTD